MLCDKQCNNTNCKHNKNKRHSYSTDEKFALFAYCIFVFYILSCIFFDDTTIFIQHAFSAIYISILVLLLMFVIILAISVIAHKTRFELVMLCMLFVGTLVLFFEKSYFYFLSPKGIDWGHYFTYISLNIAEITFTLYRLLKVKELLQFHTDSAKYFKEFDERVEKDRGDGDV